MILQLITILCRAQTVISFCNLAAINYNFINAVSRARAQARAKPGKLIDTIIIVQLYSMRASQVGSSLPLPPTRATAVVAPLSLAILYLTMERRSRGTITDLHSFGLVMGT